MKKTSSFAAIAVLLAVVAAIFVSSCSSEYTEEENCSLSENEKIEKLAEEYGLSDCIEKRPVTRGASLTDIEDEFNFFSSFAGHYDLCGTQDLDSLSFNAFNDNNNSPAILRGIATEEYSAECYERETIWGIQYYFHIKIGLTTNPYSVSSVVVTEGSCGQIECTIKDYHVSLTGALPGSINFYCQIRLSGTFYDFYYYLTGTYYLTNGTGYVDAVLRHV